MGYHIVIILINIYISFSDDSTFITFMNIIHTAAHTHTYQRVSKERGRAKKNAVSHSNAHANEILIKFHVRVPQACCAHKNFPQLFCIAICTHLTLTIETSKIT